MIEVTVITNEETADKFLLLNSKTLNGTVAEKREFEKDDKRFYVKLSSDRSGIEGIIFDLINLVEKT